MALAVGNRLIFDTWLTRLDLFAFFLPWYAFLGDRLRDFAIPGWNPHLFSGAPFAGDPESGWMYLPAMLAFTLFSAIPAFKAMVALQIAIAGLTTYAFARVLGMGAIAALAAGTVYTVGPFLHWNTYCCLIFGQFATWIPLALLGIELGLRAKTWRARIAAWFLGGFAVSQMFAGWAGEGWLYAVLLPAAYAGYRGILGPPQPAFTVPARIVSGVATAVAVPALGMALGAAGILPRLIVNAETNLAGGDYSQLGEAGVLNPPWTLEYLLIQVLGEGSGYHVRAAALGGAVTILSVLGVVMARRRYAAPFFAALTLTAWILTLETTPLHLLFYLIPRYREFHDHDAWRTVSLAAIGPAILAGAAIDLLPRWRGQRILLPVVVAPLALLNVAAAVLSRSGASLGWPPLLAAAATTAVVAFVVLSSRPGRLLGSVRHIHSIQLLLIALIVLQPTALELTGSWLGWPRHAYWEPRWNPDPTAMAALIEETSPTGESGAGAFLQADLARSGPFRYAGYGGFGYPDQSLGDESYMGRRFDPAVRALLVNGRPIFLGLYDVQGYNPLQLSRYAEFMTALNGASQDYHTAFLQPGGLDSSLLDLLDVRYLLLDASLPADLLDVVALTTGRREVFRTPKVIVYERNPAPPHAWIVHDVRQVARGEALPLLISGAIDPYRTALVEGTPPVAREPAPGTTESAQVTSYEPDALTVETNAAAPGFLVVSEVYEPGWRAYVDGKEVGILPTQHALRGVPLSTGKHTVEMRYDPWSLRLGLIVSGIAAMAMLASFLAIVWSHLPAPPFAASHRRAPHPGRSE